ncbi:hypothetical protein B0H14DRAFT_3125385 [Mycena olivaceomarginata]|nr:hypothetical protein B0H14DRAFT_3125385 [Mycena olivaceomarginata]
MVLTRSAAKAYRSIIRWLPNEILAATMVYLSRAGLVSLCRTSRLMCNIATPLLYRSVTLSTVLQLKAFLRTIEKRYSSERPLSSQVWELRIASKEDLIPPPRTSFHPLPHTSSCGYTTRCLFAKSRVVHPPHESVDFIKHLLVPEGSLVAVPLDPILLPNLTDYNGPAFALPAVDFTSAHLEWIFLVWGDHDLHIEPPLRHLRSLPSLDQFAGLTTTDHLPPAAILAGAATHLPHIRTLIFGRLDITWHRTWTELLNMAAHLKKFSALSCLILIGADDGDSTRDHDIIEHWCEACKTLSSVSLHGRLWDLVDGCWKWA